ncbi:MAG: nucleoside hydrolase [Bryobacteraceae bacterium]|nr:nucleoside hydrolase [Bryobacteraceae bacterium]MDW8380096.1 nucleoside hydrolase [Bryobacterales bacterium]
MKIFAALLMTLPLISQQRLVLDTDCGFFGDDGATLAMLVHSGKFRLEAITTVSGNVSSQQAAQNVRDILRLLGVTSRRVFLGAELPLVHTAAMAEYAHQHWGPVAFRGAFAEHTRPASNKTVNRDGVQELIRIVERAPNQITIVALGPLTNLALALRLRPEIAPKIRELVFMGGQFHVPGNASPQAEFNFWFDPEAAQIVLRSTIPKKVMFGLDICNLAVLDRQRFEEIVKVKTPLTERFRQDYGQRYPGFYQNPAAKVSVWDMLVAAWMIEPAYFGKPETLYLDVDTRFAPGYGKVIELDRRLAPDATPVQMMNALDYPQVFALIRNCLQGGKPSRHR